MASSSRALLASAARAESRLEQLRTDGRQWVDQVRSDAMLAELSQVPIDRLRDVSGSGLRLAQLTTFGYQSVADVLRAGPAQLQMVPGVGAQTANAAIAGAMRIWDAVGKATPLCLDPDHRTSATTALLQTVAMLDAAQTALRDLGNTPERIQAEFPGLLRAAAPAASRVRWFVTSQAKRSAAEDAVATLAAWLTWSSDHSAPRKFDSASQPSPRTSEDAWRAFQSSPGRFYALIEQLTGAPAAAMHPGHLSGDIVSRIAAVDLDTRLLRATLRGYQSFGAKFAIAQERVIIGDEMGLGKTMQALAVLAHLHAEGGRKFLVVCPASVLYNWQREIATHTELAAVVIHGPDAPGAAGRWQRLGGVGLTTFDTLKRMTPPASGRLDAVVIDEAHYIKNPGAGRTKTAVRWIATSPRVLMLTGTPMENRVEEFVTLVKHVRPDLAHRLDRHALLGGADAFRREVAPVYLRRNTEEVLGELPDLVEVDEWEHFVGGDARAYAAAVAEGNFMGMRQAAYPSASLDDSAKLRRLVEIVSEATANDRKLIVFSNFRRVLDAVSTALPVPVAGPLSGDTPPARRQELVDQFSRPDGPTVLVSQIQAGGTGLNIQAASVIILCEPQIKPTLEQQAIARAHRMGQARSVQVHRLLIEDTVDERLLDILAGKEAAFDTYARNSASARLSAEAVDGEETPIAANVAAHIVAQERARLGLTPGSGTASWAGQVS